MRNALIPFGCLPHPALPGWCLPGSGGYLIYRGVDAVDWSAPIACAQAGQAESVLTGLGHTPWVEYWYGVRAVSDAGVAEENVTSVGRVCVNDAGELIGPPPGPLAWATCKAVAAGRVEITACVAAPGPGQAAAASVEAARVVGGVADWDAPLATAAAGGSGVRTLRPTAVFAESE